MQTITRPLTRALTSPITGPADGALTPPAGFGWVYVVGSDGSAVGLSVTIDGVAYPIYARITP